MTAPSQLARPPSAEQLTAALRTALASPGYRPPVLPSVALDVLALAGQGDADLTEVVALLERDPVLAGRVLALAQSAQYTRRTPVVTIKQAAVRLGLLFQNAEKFNIVELTDAGRTALKARQKITLTKPVAPTEPEKHHVGEIACDEALFEKLRALRKQLADERAVPPYIIFSDVSLRQMARFYPQTDAEFSRISGVGGKKLQEFGAIFLREIAGHLKSNPRQIFAGDSFTEPPAPMPRRSRLTDTVRETLHFFRQGKTISEISRFRGLKDDTICTHLEEAMLGGEAIDVNALVSAAAQREIAAAFQRPGFLSLGQVVESLGGKYSYGECRLARAALQRL